MAIGRDDMELDSDGENEFFGPEELSDEEFFAETETEAELDARYYVEGAYSDWQASCYERDEYNEYA